ncbi:amidase [Streptomyces tremellae]|uniref:Amidase n=1 Tax=Streptomyces tremellae TaxID=1124239 RepID=A0ABP7FS31_9ACTN
MTPPHPTTEDVHRLARHFAFHLDDPAAAEYAGLVAGGLADYGTVDDLYARHVAVEPPVRSYETPADNPFGAWYVTANIAPTGPGALDGLRVAVKDNIAVAGLPMMNGSATVAGYAPSVDATVVTRVLAAGGTVAGKAVCEDLCFSGSSFTSASGAVRNPWDTSRSAGGSSSGNAALLAGGQVDVAVGGDQGGSVRLPASFCGIVGHKPTFGLVPYTGAFPIERTIDHLGPMARTVAGAARLLTVLAGSDGLDPRQTGQERAADYLAGLEDGVSGLRIGVLDEGFGLPGVSDPQVDELVADTAFDLGQAGAAVRRVSIPWYAHARALWSVIATDGGTYQMLEGNGYGLNAEGYYDPGLMLHYGTERLHHADDLAPTVKVTALTGAWTLETRKGSSYGKARALARVFRSRLDAAFADVDALILPTAPYTASLLPTGGESLTELIASGLGMIGNTAPVDVSGNPATSVPAGVVDGLPVGLMVVTPHFQDALALRVARTVEARRGPLVFPTGAGLSGAR